MKQNFKSMCLFSYLQENKIKWITWRPPKQTSIEVESLKKTNFHTRSKGVKKAPPPQKPQSDVLMGILAGQPPDGLTLQAASEH